MLVGFVAWVACLIPWLLDDLSAVFLLSVCVFCFWNEEMFCFLRGGKVFFFRIVAVQK